MPAPQTVTKTAASTDTTTFSKVTLPPGKEGVSTGSQIPAQALCIAASCNSATGTAVARFVLRNSTVIRRWVDVDLTTTSTVAVPRTAAAGGSGDYMMKVTATNDCFIDLTGYDVDAGYEWYVGLSSLTTATSVDLYLSPTRAI